MARRGLTQSDLGAALGIKQQALSRRLVGEVEFRESELSAVAALFDLPLDTLTQDQRAGANA